MKLFMRSRLAMLLLKNINKEYFLPSLAFLSFSLCYAIMNSRMDSQGNLWEAKSETQTEKVRVYNSTM